MAVEDQEDAEAAGMQHIQNSKRSLEETFATGASILTNMADQRDRLKVGCPAIWCLHAGLKFAEPKTNAGKP